MCVRSVTSPRLLIVTPIRNEAAHLDAVIDAMVRQSRRPDAWVLVDDNSTDGSRDLAEQRAREFPFMHTVSMPSDEHVGARDRLAVAAAVRAFNVGLRAVDRDHWDLIGKIDGDIEVPDDYFERLLADFTSDPTLGIAGGQIVERRRGRWTAVRVPAHHAPGALKLYRSTCFQRIGGVPEVLGWDTIDEMYARMYGFSTRSHRDLVVLHHRPTGAADGVLRGRARHGACVYAARYPRYFVIGRSLKLAAAPPAGLSGAAFLWGYARAALTRAPRVEDTAFRRHVRTELRRRIIGRLPFGLGRDHSR
jgi:poly-beta-1,6-N-acetyl-D-glucosamine synthase